MIKSSLLVLLAAVAFSTPALAQRITWKPFYAPGYANVNDVAHTKGRYVAVGNDGTVLHSPNGQTWSKGRLPDGLNCDLKAATVAFGQFWAAGVNLQSNNGVVLLSLDGINWSDVSKEFIPKNNTSAKIQGVDELFTYKTASGEALVASVRTESYDYNQIMFSTTGSVWKLQFYVSARNFFQFEQTLYGFDGDYYSPWNPYLLSSTSDSLQNGTGYGDKFPQDLTRIAYGNSHYVGVGPGRKVGYWNGVVPGNYSQNYFSYAVSPVIADFTGVAFGAGAFVAVGTNGALAESFDNGKSWSAVPLRIGTITLNGIKFVGGKFIAFGGGRIITGDPVPQRDWRVATLPSRPEEIWALATDGKLVVAVGSGGQILHSANGTSWTKAPPVTSNHLFSVDYDASTRAFYATGDKGTLLRSTTGKTWSVLKSNTNDWLAGVARAGDRLLSAGAGGSFLSSKDGKTWTSTSAGALGAAGRLVNFGNRAGFIQWIVSEGGPSGQVWMNRDGGAKWEALKTPATTTFNDAAVWNGNVYLAAENGNLYASPQRTVGGSWKSVSTRSYNAIYGLAGTVPGAGEALTAVGESGFIFSLDAKGKWRSETLFEGAPDFQDAVYFKNLCIVAGVRNNQGFIVTTSAK